MILVADSGSTKTTWSLVNTAYQTVEKCHTSGINPMYQNEDAIIAGLSLEYSMQIENIAKIFFYGAGCINRKINETVVHALQKYFGDVDIQVETDLMAVARSLCGRHEGMACILGTGSNSCYYNGSEIVQQVSPLGYMLGDEGSGAVIGKRFIADLLKNQLPSCINNLFYSAYSFTPGEIMEHVYKKPFPNRFLAQFTKFIYTNLEEPALRKIVKTSFMEFFSRNIDQYPQAQRLPLNYSGSIAWYFKDILDEAASESGYENGLIVCDPMEGLVKYHLSN